MSEPTYHSPYQNLSWQQYVAITEKATRGVFVRDDFFAFIRDLAATVLFSQIYFWHTPSKADDASKLRVKRDGHLWLCRKRADWLGEAYITEKQYDRAIGILVDLGVVEKRTIRFAGDPVSAVRIIPEGVMQRLSAIAYDEEGNVVPPERVYKGEAWKPTGRPVGRPKKEQPEQGEQGEQPVIPLKGKTFLPPAEEGEKGPLFPLREKRNSPKGKNEIPLKGKTLTETTTQTTTGENNTSSATLRADGLGEAEGEGEPASPRNEQTPLEDQEVWDAAASSVGIGEEAQGCVSQEADASLKAPVETVEEAPTASEGKKSVRSGEIVTAPNPPFRAPPLSPREQSAAPQDPAAGSERHEKAPRASNPMYDAIKAHSGLEGRMNGKVAKLLAERGITAEQVGEYADFIVRRVVKDKDREIAGRVRLQAWTWHRDAFLEWQSHKTAQEGHEGVLKWVMYGDTRTEVTTGLPGLHEASMALARSGLTPEEAMVSAKHLKLTNNFFAQSTSPAYLARTIEADALQRRAKAKRQEAAAAPAPAPVTEADAARIEAERQAERDRLDERRRLIGF